MLSERRLSLPVPVSSRNLPPYASFLHHISVRFRKNINRARDWSQQAIGTLERGGWAALQRLDASALCASKLVAQDEAPCYCGDATDDCFEHPDVIRELTKYVNDDDDDDEEVEAIAPAPRQAPPAGWGKLISA